jgi:gluconate kinase
MNKFSILLLLCIACTQKTKDYQLERLPPITYEFNAKEKKNRIDYFYIEGDFLRNTSGYNELKMKMGEKLRDVDMRNYFLYSVYIYRKTEIINKKYNGGRDNLNRHHQDLLAYARYKNGKLDIFYILEKGNVVYDVLSNKEESFEFNQ